jgi:hypothetical protein
MQATEHLLPGEERMFSINIRNLTDKPIDLSSASFFGVDDFTGRQFDLRPDSGMDDPVLARGGFAVVRGFFPVNGESARELCVRLKDGRIIRYYRSNHSLKPFVVPARRR